MTGAFIVNQKMMTSRGRVTKNGDKGGGHSI